MQNRELIFRLRKKIFDEWRHKGYGWRDIKERYGFSKAWFYKYLGRFLTRGEEGLRDIAQNTSHRPQRMSSAHKMRLLEYVYDHPTHGPKRIAMEQDFPVTGKTVWKYLVAKDLNTRRIC